MEGLRIEGGGEEPKSFFGVEKERKKERFFVTQLLRSFRPPFGNNASSS